jgi:hypothetical protein
MMPVAGISKIGTHRLLSATPSPMKRKTRATYEGFRENLYNPSLMRAEGDFRTSKVVFTRRNLIRILGIASREPKINRLPEAYLRWSGIEASGQMAFKAIPMRRVARQISGGGVVLRFIAMAIERFRCFRSLIQTLHCRPCPVLADLSLLGQTAHDPSPPVV